MSSEVLFKIVLIGGLTIIWIICIRWVQVTQLDPAMTLSRLLGKIRDKVEAPRDWVATRDPNKIYQNGKVAGDVIGPVEERQGRLHFAQLANTRFDSSKPFEYQRDKLRVKTVGTFAATKIGADANVLTGVFEDVLCERVQP